MSPALHDSRALALDALHAIDAGTTRDEWFRAGAAALAAGLDVEDVDAWSATAGNYRGSKDVRSAFRRVKPGGGIGAGTLYYLARAQGWRPPKDGEAIKPRPVREKVPVHPAAQDEPQHERLSERGHRLWDACEPLAGVALQYLEARGCAIPPEDGDLRMHPALRHPDGHTGPALVALVTDARTREPLTLHRTWIAPGGQKAAIEKPRLLLGGHRKTGGVIRLWPDDAVTTSLAVAEGVETALSLAHVHPPAWSLIDAGNLAAFPALAGIEVLLIGADHDPAGIKAAKECGTRWHQAGARVHIILPPEARTDLNDVVKEAA